MYIEFYSQMYNFSVHPVFLYRAPEILRLAGFCRNLTVGTQKADVYSFGIILYELHSRHGPFGKIGLKPVEILDRVIGPSDYPFR